MMAFCSIKATEYSGEVEQISHMPSGLSGHIVYKNHQKNISPGGAPSQDVRGHQAFQSF